MSASAIEAAFRIKLSELALAPVWYENAPPPATKPYLEARFMPAETYTPTFGPDGIREYVGLYNINVVTDAGIGSGAAGALADSVVAAFPRASQIVAPDGLVVTVEKSWRSPAIEGEGRYVVPVNIRYYSFSNQ